MAAATVFTATVKLTYTDGSAPAVGGTVIQTANGITDRIVPLAAGATDTQVDMDFLFANVKEFFAISTQDGTIETNATNHAGGDIITLKANVPYWWSSTSGVANPFTNNVTTLYLTNSSTSTAAQMDIRLLYAA